MVTPLLEREDELAALISAVDESLDGRGTCLLLAGEAGAGKTSLVRELRRRLGAEVTFMGASCEALSVPAPLAPVRELAGDLPELHGDDRFALALAVLAVVRDRAPAVVVLEDAHWADPGTLDVARVLARRVDGIGAVLVVTYRDDELGSNRALAALVGDLSAGQAVRLQLRPLSERAVHALTRDAGLDARDVLELTNGNPFLVVETVSAGGGLPASVRDATLARVARLGDAARRVVEGAAVLGHRVRPTLLAQIAPHDVEALEEAVACGVLVDDGESLGFRHELTRQAIEQAISAPRAQVLHAAVVAALAAEHPIPVARLAHHAERAGLEEEAGRYAELAAAEAEQVGALAEASRQLERALRHYAPGRFELLLRYVRATNFAGELNEALRAADEAVSLAERELGPVARARALIVQSWSKWSLDRVVEAKHAAESAVALLIDAGDVAELARAQAADLRMESTAFDAAKVIASAPGTLRLAEQAGLEDVRIDVTISVGLARGHRGDPEALELLEGALEDAQRAHLPFQTVRAYVNAVDVAAESRDHENVERLAADAIRRLDTFQTTIPRETIDLSLARSLLDRGRYDDALERAVAGRRSGHGGAPVGLALEGLVHARRGDARADELLAEAWSVIEGLPEGWRHGLVRVALAESAWLRGDHAAVVAQASSGLAAPAAGNLARFSGELALWSTRAGVAAAPQCAPEAVLLELAGDWRAAVRAWTELDAPYEAALAALPGDERAARAAAAALHRLGAGAAARAFARERTRRGERAPRGPRSTTLANTAGLTRREQEVLAHVARGATNPAIAALLHLSERTVAHHMSAILSKLGAPTRLAAVDAARRAGLLAQDGTAAPPT